MGRAERRRMERKNRIDARVAFAAYERAKDAEVEKIVLDAVQDAENYVKHHITGELYTAMAVILRRPPYRWPAEKVLRLLDAVGGIINDLSEKRICDADLVTEGERWGIKVQWDAHHEFIEGISEFERDTGCRD
jgi:hypothetical protein